MVLSRERRTPGASSSATQIGANYVFNNVTAPTLFGPSLYIIPAGTISDNEVLEFITTMSSVDSSCPQGFSCNLFGHPVKINGLSFTTGNCAVNSVSPAACGSAVSGVFAVPSTTTTYTVNATPVTANSRIFIHATLDNTGIPSAPTCTSPASPFQAFEASRVAGTSFTGTFPSTTGTTCWIFWIVN